MLQQANAQKKLLKQVDERNIVVLTDSGHTIEADVKHFDINEKKNKMYAWYWKDQIKYNYGESEGVLLHGGYLKYDSDKNLIEKVIFKKGLKRGKHLYWNSNGTYARIENWKKGILKGKYKLFDHEGFLLETGRYKKGLKHGRIKRFTSGVPLDVVKYKNGEQIEPKNTAIQDTPLSEAEKESVKDKKASKKQKKEKKKPVKEESLDTKKGKEKKFKDKPKSEKEQKVKEIKKSKKKQ